MPRRAAFDDDDDDGDRGDDDDQKKVPHRPVAAGGTRRRSKNATCRHAEATANGIIYVVCPAYYVRRVRDAARMVRCDRTLLNEDDTRRWLPHAPPPPGNEKLIDLWRILQRTLTIYDTCASFSGGGDGGGRWSSFGRRCRIVHSRGNSYKGSF